MIDEPDYVLSNATPAVIVGLDYDKQEASFICAGGHFTRSFSELEQEHVEPTGLHQALLSRWGWTEDEAVKLGKIVYS